MSEIINIYLLEDFIKRKQKIHLLGWNKDIPTYLNKFTTSTGTLNSRVVGGESSRTQNGGSQKIKNRILVI
jgi:ribosomal protein S18